MIQVCMKHIVSHILYGLSLFLVSRDICLLCDYEMSICLLQWTVFHNKTMHRKSYDLTVYLSYGL